MKDTSAFELLQYASPVLHPSLLVLDENSGHILPSPVTGMQVISNRYDIYLLAQRAGWHSTFSDFDFSGIAPASLQQALYRISKEKRVVEHVLQSLWQCLQINGTLYIAGFKNEGIKTFAKRISEAWDCEACLVRGEQKLHLYSFRKPGESRTMLNTADYTALVHITDWNALPLWSKPGIFAWDRLDEGSCYLLEQLPAVLDGVGVPRRGLDIGCGSGLLSLALIKAGCSEIVATDNNAAALTATAHNLKACVSKQIYSVQAADAGAGISLRADLLLCNPPFHQGFAIDNTLTLAFLQAAHRLLAPRGQALFVVNSFIPLEKLASDLFSLVSIVSDNRRFKVIRLAHQ